MLKSLKINDIENIYYHFFYQLSTKKHKLVVTISN